MDWIKRNLYFLLAGVGALALLGMAGYFLYSKWSANNEEMAKLNQDYQELQNLNSQKPHPGFGQVNNIKLAKEQREEVRGLIQKAHAQFEPIPSIPPGGTNVSDSDFASALSRTIDMLQKRATNSSVVLPPNYHFSFSAQKSRVNLAPGSPVRLAVQLGEIKAICDILFAAKVNSLDNIRRERVSTDDSTGGNLTDYFEKKSVTNNLAIVTPYEVTFKAFSPELAAALSGFASSPHGIIVKAINVEPAPAATPTEDATQPLQPTVSATPVFVPSGETARTSESSAAAAAFQRRYGLGPGGRGGGRPGMNPMPAQPMPQPQPVYTPQPVAPQPAKLQTVLDEKQLKVTLLLNVVKLLPEGSAPQSAAPQPDAAQNAPTS